VKLEVRNEAGVVLEHGAALVALKLARLRPADVDRGQVRQHVHPVQRRVITFTTWTQCKNLLQMFDQYKNLRKQAGDNVGREIWIY
jgi:hypothetical protein